MKRIRIAGLCFVAMLAMSAIGASASYAHRPVWIIGGKILQADESVHAKGEVTPLHISDIIDGQSVELSCTELKWEQDFIGGEPGEADMEVEKQDLVEGTKTCTVLKPAGEETKCKVTRLEMENQTWPATLLRNSEEPLTVPPGGLIWQHIPEVVENLEYDIEGAECTVKGDEKTGEKLLGNFGPFEPGPFQPGKPAGGLSFTNGAEAVVQSPHFFRNSGGAFGKASKVAEGVKVPVVAWGNLELTAEGVPTTECQNVVGGYIENPKGGGAGKGATESFNAYNCKNATCLAPNFESVQARNLNGEHETSTEGPFGSGNQVKWPSVLEEKVAGTIRTNSSNVSVLVGCRESAGHLVEGTFVECFTEPGVDEQTPRDENGTGIGSAPSKTEFDAESGSLNCSGAFKGKTGKSLKVMGYNEQEIIETAE